MKRCNKCKIFKDLSEFHLQKDTKDGRRATCKECRKFDKSAKEKLKIWKQNNKSILKEKNKVYNQNYKERRNELRKIRKQNDPVYKFSENISRTIKQSFSKKGFTKNSRTYEILGCTYDEFIIHIENQFQEWMTWENYGSYTGNYHQTWQLDHIKPISLASTEEEIIFLNHYSNFRPLCSRENIEKSNFYIN